MRSAARQALIDSVADLIRAGKSFGEAREALGDDVTAGVYALARHRAGAAQSSQDDPMKMVLARFVNWLPRDRARRAARANSWLGGPPRPEAAILRELHILTGVAHGPDRLPTGPRPDTRPWRRLDCHPDNGFDGMSLFPPKTERSLVEPRIVHCRSTKRARGYYVMGDVLCDELDPHDPACVEAVFDGFAGERLWQAVAALGEFESEVAA